MGGMFLFGVYGYNFEGIWIGQEEGWYGKVVKVWDKCEYKNFDDSVEFGI